MSVLTLHRPMSTVSLHMSMYTRRIVRATKRDRLVKLVRRMELVVQLTVGKKECLWTVICRHIYYHELIHWICLHLLKAKWMNGCSSRIICANVVIYSSIMLLVVLNVWSFYFYSEHCCMCSFNILLSNLIGIDICVIEWRITSP